MQRTTRLVLFSTAVVTPRACRAFEVMLPPSLRREGFHHCLPISSQRALISSQRNVGIVSDVSESGDDSYSRTIMGETDDDNDHHDENNRIIHLNHAGASPSPPSVLETVIRQLQLEQRIGGYAAEQAKQDSLSQVYHKVAKLVHASSPLEIALVESATVAWTRLFYAMAAYQQQQQHALKTNKRVILVSEAEYAANIVAACHWARTHENWTVQPIPSSIDSNGHSTGIIDVPAFQNMMGGSSSSTSVDSSNDIALVCVTHIPTNSGIVNPVEEIGGIISDYNEKNSNDQAAHGGEQAPRILYLVDACQSIGQMDVNVRDIQCHGLAATGRKYLRGPRGTGFLYVQSHVADLLMPSHLDHASAPVTRVPPEYPPPSNNVEDWIDLSIQPGAKRFEFWESNIAGKLGLGEAVRYAMDEMGLGHICSCCELVVSELSARLQAMNGIDVHHESSCGIVTFTVSGVDAAKVKELLWTLQSADDYRFEVSVVPATSTPLDSAHCNVPDLVRASVSCKTSLEEIDLFCTKLLTIVDNT